MEHLERNWSENGTVLSAFSSPLEDETIVLKNLRILSYAAICIIGTIGNVLVLLTTRKRRMRTVTNLFIANLALADLAVCILAIPISVAYSTLGYWPFGSFLCKTMPYLQGITVSASIGTLVAIACDRFIVIVYPTIKKLRVSQTSIAIVLIWILSALVSIPVNLHSEVVSDIIDGVKMAFCMEVWSSHEARNTYSLIVFLVLFLLPIGVMSAMYLGIIIKLKKLQPTQEGNQI